MGLLLNGSFASSANAQIRLIKPTGGSELFTSIQGLKLDDEINAVLVQAIGSYGPVGSTDGDVKATGELSMPFQEMQYFEDQLASLHPNGSSGLVKFGITVTVSNGVDPTIIVKGGKCRMLKRMFELTKGSPEPIVS